MPLRVQTRCPTCKQDLYVEAWQSLDFGQAPELRQRLLDGEINLPICPNCGRTAALDMPFLIDDPKNKRVIFFIPGFPEHADPANVHLLRTSLRALHPRPRQRRFKNPVQVGDWKELVQLVAEGAYTPQGSGDPDQLRKNLASLCVALRWESKRDLLTAHPELLGDGASALLDAHVDQARREGVDELELRLVLTRWFCRRCREVGINTAYNEAFAGMPITSSPDGAESIKLPVEHREILDSERLVDLEHVEAAARGDPRKMADLITRFEDALSWPVVAEDPEWRAVVLLVLGTAYWNLSGGNRVRNLHRAIACLSEALRVYTPESAPDRHANVQNQLGLAYLDLPTYDQAENVNVHGYLPGGCSRVIATHDGFCVVLCVGPLVKGAG